MWRRSSSVSYGPVQGVAALMGLPAVAVKPFGSPSTLLAYVSSAAPGLPLLHSKQTGALLDTAAVTQLEGCTQEAVTETNGRRRRRHSAERLLLPVWLSWTELGSDQKESQGIVWVAAAEKLLDQLGFWQFLCRDVNQVSSLSSADTRNYTWHWVIPLQMVPCLKCWLSDKCKHSLEKSGGAAAANSTQTAVWEEQKIWKSKVVFFLLYFLGYSECQFSWWPCESRCWFGAVWERHHPNHPAGRETCRRRFQAGEDVVFWRSYDLRCCTSRCSPLGPPQHNSVWMNL